MLGNRQNTIAFRMAGENEYGELRVVSGIDELNIDYSDTHGRQQKGGRGNKSSPPSRFSKIYIYN
jgi:hypothetical protein